MNVLSPSNNAQKIPQSGIYDRCMANIKPMQEVECALGDMGRGYQKNGGWDGKKKKVVGNFFFLGGGVGREAKNHRNSYIKWC